MRVLAIVASAAITVASSADGEDSLSLLQTHAFSVQEEAEEDAPLCQQHQTQMALDQMHGECPLKVFDAIKNNKPLSEKERCLCYLEVDESFAAELQCRSMPAKRFTLAQEYKTCKDNSDKLLGRKGKVCSLTRLKPHLDKMDETCQVRMYDAIKANTPMTFEQRCECYRQVDSSAMVLDCRAMPGKTTTVAEDWWECMTLTTGMDDETEPDDTSNPHPVCKMDEVQAALAQMHGDCPAKVTNAVLSNTPLTDRERCLCYLEVDEPLATSISCRTMMARRTTLAEDYMTCKKTANAYTAEKNLCEFSRIKTQLDKMTEPCQVRMYNAIQTNYPCTKDERCECYRQIDEASAMALTCHSMPAKTSTVAEEWQECMADGAF